MLSYDQPTVQPFAFRPTGIALEPPSVPSIVGAEPFHITACTVPNWRAGYAGPTVWPESLTAHVLPNTVPAGRSSGCTEPPS